MSAADARATSAGKSCLDYKQSPRPFTPFKALLYPKGFFERQRPTTNRPTRISAETIPK